MATKMKGVEGVKTSNLYKARLERFVIEPGFNIRKLDKESTQRKIEEMALCYKEGRQLPPLEVFLGENSTLILNDGHCRFTAAGRAQERGWIPADFELTFYEGKGNVGDRIASMLRSGTIDDPLTQMEIAEGYKRLRGLNYEHSQIAAMVGKSPTYVAKMLELADAPPELQQMVRNEEVAASTVVDVVRASGGATAAVTVLKEAVAVAKAAGKQKATPKHVKAVQRQAQPQLPTGSGNALSRPARGALDKLQREVEDQIDGDSQVPMSEMTFTISGATIEALLAELRGR